MYVKPKQGIVLMPDKKMKRMPEDGAEVPRDSYYTRLLKLGDIVEAKPPRKSPPAKPAEKKAQAAEKPKE